MKTKVGILFVGKPSFHLHEAICLALYLEAPIAFTDADSLQIAEKFEGIIKVIHINDTFSPGMFISGFEKIYTNLQPVEFAPFIQIQFIPKKMQVVHLFEEHFHFLTPPKNAIFASSLLDAKFKIPSTCEFEYLGPISYLSFIKNKKELRKLAELELSKNTSKRLKILDLTIDSSDLSFSDEQSIDQIHFHKSSICGFENRNSAIAIHGLVDPLIEQTNAVILRDEIFFPQVLFHKKPFFIEEKANGAYQVLNPLLTKLPHQIPSLVPLIDNYFDFETINREELSTKLKNELFKNAIFS